MERIEAELLIPGSGEPVSDGVVIIDNSVISYAGPASQAPATRGAAVHRTETVMPGMWDCHGHFLGMRVFDLGRLPLNPVPLRAARCTRDLRAALRAARNGTGLSGNRPRSNTRIPRKWPWQSHMPGITVSVRCTAAPRVAGAWLAGPA